MKLLHIILKNWKILTRNTFSLVIITLGPLLIITLAGIAFNNSLDHDIKIGVFSQEYSETSEQFLEKLSEDFEVVRFESRDECVTAINIRGFHSCIEIPANLEVGRGDTLNFYIDISRTNIASSIQQSIFQSLYDTTQTISEDLTANLVETVRITEENIMRDSTKINTEIERVSESTESSKKSLELLQQSNLDFNPEDIQPQIITNAATAVRSQINSAKSAAQNAIDAIDSSGSSDEDILNARIEIQQIQDNIDNASNNISQLISATQTLSSTINTLENNLRGARENRDVASTQLTTIQTELQKTQEELETISESFREILASIQTNPLREAQAIIRPVEIEETAVVTGSRIQLLFPSLIILIIMLVTMMMGSSQVIFEKTNRAAKRMAMAPIRFITQATGIFTTTFAITLLQITIILLVTYFVFKINIGLITTGILLLTTIFFILLGMIIGYIFKTENGALLGTLSLASIFFVVSDLILPLESMHPTVMRVVEYFPFVLATDLLKTSMFFDVSIGAISLKLYALLGATLFLAIILVIAGLFKRKPKKLLKK